MCVDAGVGPYSYPEAEGGTHGWDEIWRHLCSFSFLLSFIFLTATKKKNTNKASLSLLPPPPKAGVSAPRCATMLRFSNVRPFGVLRCDLGSAQRGAMRVAAPRRPPGAPPHLPPQPTGVPQPWGKVCGVPAACAETVRSRSGRQRGWEWGTPSRGWGQPPGGGGGGMAALVGAQHRAARRALHPYNTAHRYLHVMLYFMTADRYAL